MKRKLGNNVFIGLFITFILIHEPIPAFANSNAGSCKIPENIDMASIKMGQQSNLQFENSSSSGGLNADILFSMVNNYRKQYGFPEFQKDERSCNLETE